MTREAIAEVMGVELERREELVEHIAALFGDPRRDMPENNLRQADVPVGGGRRSRTRSAPRPASAPRCRTGGDKVVYAVPGVPYEMQQMVNDHVLPDLLARSGERR